MFNLMMMTLGYITFGFIVGCALEGVRISIQEYIEKKDSSHEYECEEK